VAILDPKVRAVRKRPKRRDEKKKKTKQNSAYPRPFEPSSQDVEGWTKKSVEQRRRGKKEEGDEQGPRNTVIKPFCNCTRAAEASKRRVWGRKNAV